MTLSRNTIFWILVISISLFLVLFVLGISFGFGFGFGTHHQVSYEYNGILYNRYTGDIDYQKIYEPGRHYVGAISEFILIPKLYKSMDFRGPTVLGAVTKNGIQVNLDISFQYKVDAANAINVFRSFGHNYEQVIVNKVRNILRDITSKYVFNDFIVNRTHIGNEMDNTVRDNIKSELNVTIFDVQLRNSDFPDSIEQAYLINENNKIMRERELYQLETSLLVAKKQNEIQLQNATNKADELLLTAKRKLEIEYINAITQANITTLLADSKNRITVTTGQAHANVLYNYKSSLYLNNTELISLVYINSLKEMENNTMFVNFQTSPILNVKP